MTYQMLLRILVSVYKMNELALAGLMTNSVSRPRYRSWVEVWHNG
jgi:hypothetical protein